MPPVAGSHIWLDPSLGLYQEIAGITPADTDGEVVGKWEDQSGNLNHFNSVADGANRPVFKTNIVNGLPVVRADGSDDYLRSINNITLTNFTVHMLIVPRHANIDRRIVYQYDGVDGWYAGLLNTTLMQHITPNVTLAGSLTINAPVILTVQRGGGQITLRINGIEVATGAVAVPTTIAQIFMFASLTPASFGQVDLGELLIYNSLLSGGDVGLNETYLSARFAVALETSGSLLVWLKSDTGTFQDVAATTPAVADGDVVGYWADQSGKGNHFTSVTDGAQRPTLQTNELNGYPVIRMDGVNDYLRSISEIWLKEFTATIVFMPRIWQDGRVFYHYDTVDGTALRLDAASGFQHFTPNVSAGVSIDILMPNIITLEKIVGAITSRRNGEEIETTVLASTPTTIDEIYLAISALLTFPTNIEYAELIIRRGVNTVQRDIDEAYLAARYAVPLVFGNLWVQLTDMPTPREQHGFEELGGLLYAVCGSTTGGVDIKTTISYNPVTDTWDNTLSDIPGTVRQSGILRAVSGKLYFIGGHLAAGAYYNDVYEYTPIGDSWATKLSMTTLREDMGSAVYNNLIFVFGGLAAGDLPTNVMEVYNPALNTWDNTLADLPVNKWSGDFGAEIGGKIYAIGSTDTYFAYPTLTPNFSVYEYDPVGDAWVQKANVPSGISYKEVVSDGTYLYVIAGTSTSDAAVHRAVLRYNPLTDTWLYMRKVPYLARGSGLAFFNGAIYMSGGWRGGVFLDDLYKLNLTTMAVRSTIIMAG